MMIKNLTTFIHFSRPHTIIGSTLSIVVLWLMANRNWNETNQITILLLTLVAGITCNIFIVGLNQIIDIDLDRINKPKLPLPRGTLSMQSAKNIVFASLVLSIFFGFLAGNILGGLIIVINLIGIAYSVPPIQLKKHHLPAALSITVVRGILVNFGMYIHFAVTGGMENGSLQTLFTNLPEDIWILTIFIVAFSIAIAWFKDLPDTIGDARYKFRTLAVVYSPKVALFSGSAFVIFAYITAIHWAKISEIPFLFYYHIIALLLFIANLTFVSLKKGKTVTRFYLIFWIFFFAEYISFGIFSLITNN